MTIQKLSSNTPDVAKQNIQRLAELFPECLTEAPGLAPRIDFDALKQALADHLVEGGTERYRLDWPGKRQAMLEASAPIDKTLRPLPSSVEFDTTRNLFIEGDNLDALKLLQETYLDKIKMIYIDPPYNTGSDFIYNDRFQQSIEAFEILSEQRGDGRLVSNPQTNGRFHSDWLSMMLPRLKLARSLLADDGLIFISIDDNQQASLRILMDSLFGEGNFVDQIVWKKRYGGGSKEKHYITLHEYVLVYCKSIESLPNLEIPLSQESISRYYKSRDANFEARGPYRTHPLEATKSMGARHNLVYPIKAPDGSSVSPKRQWLWSKERTEEALQRGELEFIKDRSGQWSVHTKQYLRDEDGSVRKGKPFSIIDDVYTQHGTNEIIDLFGDARVFPFPKPTAFLRKLLEVALSRSSGRETIVDLFGGSGSLAHSVMKYNADRGTSHAVITIQLDENISEDQEAYARGFRTIADVGRERIQLAASQLKSEKSAVDVGFRHLRIDTGNFNDTRLNPRDATQESLAGMVSHIKANRTAEDLLFGALLSWGVDITLPIEKRTVEGHELWFVDAPSEGNLGAAVIACFDRPNGGKGGIDTALADAIAAMKPLRALFRDDGFATDAVKENVASRFKQRSPDTTLRVL